MRRAANWQSASSSRSMQVRAVAGSLMPGDSARTASSTSWLIKNPRSWVPVRSGPMMKAARIT